MLKERRRSPKELSIQSAKRITSGCRKSFDDTVVRCVFRISNIAMTRARILQLDAGDERLSSRLLVAASTLAHFTPQTRSGEDSGGYLRWLLPHIIMHALHTERATAVEQVHDQLLTYSCHCICLRSFLSRSKRCFAKPVARTR